MWERGGGADLAGWGRIEVMTALAITTWAPVPQAVPHDSRVLEIGTGIGLLAMLAVRCAQGSPSAVRFPHFLYARFKSYIPKLAFLFRFVIFTGVFI